MPIAILLITIQLLTGCAITAKPNFESALPPWGTVRMAREATDQLVSIAPPATTTFSLKEQPTDPFGTALTAMLRERGYGIDDSQTQPPGMPLSYAIHEIGASQYALTLSLGTQKVSCLFQLAGGTLNPVGYWVRKE